MRPERPPRRRILATMPSNRGGEGSTTDPIPADRSAPGDTRAVTGVTDAHASEPQVGDAHTSEPQVGDAHTSEPQVGDAQHSEPQVDAAPRAEPDAAEQEA